MTIESSISLQPFNTFGVNVTARHYVKVTSVGEIRRALAWAQDNATQIFILGGGSNILFTKDIDGLVIHIDLKGITTQFPDNETPGFGKCFVTIAAGEDWSKAVWWAASNGLGGIENLYLIPGTAGAAAVQNIGAYGVELCDVCHHVTALHLPTGAIHDLSVKDCQFGYRDSLFKRQSGVWIVLSITLELNKNAPLNTGYGALKETLDQQAGSTPMYTDVACAVAGIREAKLPSPDTIGSAGSFFKNPVIPSEQYQKLLAQYPGMPAYEQGDGYYKLSASWLLDTAGWKQKDRATVGCYPRQPLVLINKGTATGQEILAFSEEIQNDIAKRFGITLEREVVVYP